MQKNERLAELLKSERASAHYSQTDVSEHLAISRSTYGHYEEGVRVPPPEFFLEISALYNKNPLLFLSCYITEEMREKNPNYFNRLANNFHTPPSKEIKQTRRKPRVKELR